MRGHLGEIIVMGCDMVFWGREAHRKVENRQTIVDIAVVMVPLDRPTDLKKSYKSLADPILIGLISIL
jgi:hypothetical protein